MKHLKMVCLILLLLSFYSCSYLYLQQHNLTNAIVVTITLLLIVVPPLCIYIFVIRPRAIHKLFVYVSVIVSIGIAYWLIPSTYNGFFKQLLVWFIPALEIALVLLVVYTVIKTVVLYKRANKMGEQSFIQLVTDALQPKLGNGFLLAAIVTELSVFYYAIFLSFKKPTFYNSKNVYTYHKTSQLKIILIVFSLLLVLEGVLLHYLLHLWSNIAAWVFTLLNLYGLLYLISLYHSVRWLPHQVEEETLILQFGFQSRMELPIANIDRIEPVKNQTGLGEKKAKDTYYAMFHMDTAQYEIFLKKPTIVKSAYGRKRAAKSVIFRADEPNKFLKHIHENLARLNGKEP